MWMAVSGLNDAEAELLLAVAPDVFALSEMGLHFVDLRRVHRYWALAEGFDRLRAQLGFLPVDRATYAIAPTAAQAAFAHRVLASGTVLFSAELNDCYQQAPIEELANFVLSSTGGISLAHWSAWIEDFESLGFLTLADLCFFERRTELFSRWGKPLERLLRVVLGESDWELVPLALAPVLEAKLAVGLERAMNSPQESDLLKRLEMVLEQWQLRLQLRRLRMGALRVSVRTQLSRRQYDFVLKVPRALASAKDFLPMLQERLLQGFGEDHQNELGTEEISDIALRSLALEPDFDVQLHLLEPDQESLEQSWSQAIGHMYSYAKQEGDLRFGAYVPAPSFLPESSLRWADGALDSLISPIEDHPARPTLLLKNPERLARPPQTYEMFLEWALAEGIAEGLEKLRSPWVRADGLRVYVRHHAEWIFWSERDGGLYRHGWF